MQTVIVVPCYDEAKRLRGEAFAEFASAHADVSFLFVNDGSTDDTLSVLRDIEALAPAQFSVMDLAQNGGKAEAVRRGLVKSFERDPALVGFWDADLATPLDAIPEFQAILEAQPELDMVFGARVKLLGRQIERLLVRHYLGRVFATVTSSMLRLPVYDTQCGAKLFRATPEIRSLFTEPFVANWVFDVEIIARLIQARRKNGRPDVGASIYELPLREWKDVAGSKVRARDFPRAFIEMARIYAAYFMRD